MQIIHWITPLPFSPNGENGRIQMEKMVGTLNNELLRTKVRGTRLILVHMDFLWLWRVGDSAFNGTMKQKSETVFPHVRLRSTGEDEEQL